VTVDPSGIARASSIERIDDEGVGVTVGSGVAVGCGVGVGVTVGAVVGSALAVGVGTSVGMGVGVSLGVAVGPADDVALGVGESVALGVGVGPVPGTTGEARFCGDGVGETNQSLTLSFVSVPFPEGPPGRRSMLDEAGGAATGAPSTNGFVASPQPTASITAPPTTRSAMAPPVAAKPPVYVASPMPTYEPTLFARRIRCPGASIVEPVHVAFRVTVEPVDVA
jgi:hypothetical protein